MKVSGNDLFVTAMKKEGVDTIFAYPGGMVVNLLDSMIVTGLTSYYQDMSRG